MKHLLALLLTGTSALAEPAYLPPNAFELPDELTFYADEEVDSVLGKIIYWNMENSPGQDQDVYTLPTPAGDILVQLTLTRNIDCPEKCPDTAEVLSVPDGYVAVPYRITVAEGQIATIRVIQHIGL